MEVVATLLVLVVLVWVWFLIAKNMKKKGRGFFLRHLVGSTAGSMAMIITATTFLATGILEESEKKESSTQTASANTEIKKMLDTETPTPAPVIRKVETNTNSDLDVTPAQFADNFNAGLKSVQMNMKAPKPQITSGEVNDVYRLALNDNIHIIGSINKHNGALRDITLVGAGDGTPKSGADIMLVSVAMFMAVSKTVTDQDKQAGTDVLLALFKKLDSSRKKGASTASTLANGLKYTVAQPESMGTWISIAPAN